MEKVKIYFLFCFCLINLCRAQTTFWYEGFGVGCSQGVIADGSIATPSNGAWSMFQTASGSQANQWYISATEDGKPIGICGDGCLNTTTLTNRSLHIGKSALLQFDSGAIYLKSPASRTNKRMFSPIIDCSLKSNLVLSFNYLSGGISGVDYADCGYDDGSSWYSLGTLLPTTGTCSPKGTWVSQTYTLPVFANGIPTIRIGFSWYNVPGPVGFGLSVAIDEIALSGVPLTGLKEENSKNHHTILYPNPTSGKLFIENKELQKITITNYLGQTVFNSENGEFKQEIDLSSFAKGVYFLNLQSKTIQKVYKIIKE